MRFNFPNICRLLYKKEKVWDFMYSWRIGKKTQKPNKTVKAVPQVICQTSLIYKCFATEIEYQYYFSFFKKIAH